MRRLILTSAIIWMSLSAKSQSKADGPPFSEFNHLITYGIGVNVSVFHEIRYERFFDQRWSLHYTLGLSQNDSRDYSEYRIPLGPTVIAGLGVSAAACELGNLIYLDNLDFIRLALFLPDGISYHQPLPKGYYFSPYINWSGISVRFLDTSNRAQWIYTPKIGLRLLKPIGKMGVISAEQTIQRSENNTIQFYPSIGISIRF